MRSSSECVTPTSTIRPEPIEPTRSVTPSTVESTQADSTRCTTARTMRSCHIADPAKMIE